MKTMNHKQTTSISTIPFSWEMIPGVPKLMVTPQVASPPLPPPPLPRRCYREPIMKRSVSSMLWREEDPFLLALKECSKDYKVKGDKKRFGILGSKSFLWCRCSYDVEEGNLKKRPVTTRGGPVSSAERVHGLIRIHKGLRNWNTWILMDLCDVWLILLGFVDVLVNDMCSFSFPWILKNWTYIYIYILGGLNIIKGNGPSRALVYTTRALSIS